MLNIENKYMNKESALVLQVMVLEDRSLERESDPILTHFNLKNCVLKNLESALAGVVQWIECWPGN